MYFDVIIAGGSIAGLICAREIASNQNSVLVLEEDYEIGTPEHCGGLVSMEGLMELGIIPFRNIYGSLIEKAEIFAPDGNSFSIDVTKQKIVEISRRELDKQLAFQAQNNGAIIKTHASFQEFSDNTVKTNDGEFKCKLFVDARGVSSIIHKDRTGVLLSAQYEVYANWIQKGKIEVYFDQTKYPGFFAWIIPSGDGKGKIGVAGKGINTSVAINKFLESRKEYSIIRKIFAPIWIKGPVEKFVDNGIVIVGDAAGQAKPTTAGGIYSSGMGGMLAGKSISKFLKTNNILDLHEYQQKWFIKFGKEFEKQSTARKLLEKLDNNSINKLFELITPDIVKEISEKDDFDFHASSIIKLLGIRNSLSTLHTLFRGELTKFLDQRYRNSKQGINDVMG